MSLNYKRDKIVICELLVVLVKNTNLEQILFSVVDKLFCTCYSTDFCSSNWTSLGFKPPSEFLLCVCTALVIFRVIASLL